MDEYRYIKLFLIIIILSAVFNSCGRYEYGPSSSLRSVKTRLAGEWTLTDLLVNDETDDNLYENESVSCLSIKKDGKFEYVNSNVLRSAEKVSITGSWVLAKDKMNISLFYEDSIIGIMERDYKILRLTNEELWVSDENSQYHEIDEIIERHYEKK